MTKDRTMLVVGGRLDAQRVTVDDRLWAHGSVIETTLHLPTSVEAYHPGEVYEVKMEVETLEVLELCTENSSVKVLHPRHTDPILTIRALVNGYKTLRRVRS